MDVTAEMNKELRRARGWLLAVGILMLILNLVGVYATKDSDAMPAAAKAIGALISGVIFAAFLALWWFAKRKPKLCLTLGLVLYWGLQIWNAFYDPSTLYQGIILKILFTGALVKGIQSAGRAEVLHEQVVKVFE